MTLSANGTTFGTLTSPPYQVSLSLLTPGTVTFTAVATDNWGGQTSTSMVATVTGSGNYPLLTNGLRLQLAADLGVTTNADGSVATWADQSASANNAAPTDASTAPLQIPNALNGKPVVRFAASQGHFLLAPGDTSYTAGDISSFVMLKFNNFSGYRSIWSKTIAEGSGLPAPTDWFILTGSGRPNVVRGGNSVYGSFAAGAVPAGVFQVAGFTASGQAITHYNGYTATGSGTIPQTPVDAGLPLHIGFAIVASRWMATWPKSSSTIARFQISSGSRY